MSKLGFGGVVVGFEDEELDIKNGTVPNLEAWKEHVSVSISTSLA